MADMHTSNRRRFLKGLFGVGASFALPTGIVSAKPASPIVRAIPATGETLPVIGMGSWLTFDVGGNRRELQTRVEVLRTFFDHGGALIDSSPMYGSSEEVIGYCLKQLNNADKLFSATKVWTWGKKSGINQMELSRKLWGIRRFDLMQIHNMLDWESHLETLQVMKAEGKIRYLGITTSHGRRHDDLEQALTDHQFDFMQFTYNILERETEKRLLPLAQERGIAVIINRPFDGGDLFAYVRGKPLPKWAAEFDCHNWAQFFLKFIVSHPAVTCAIPATTRVDHMKQNMGAGLGRLPDQQMRQRMIHYFKSL
jgi:diketogulonate reductase-like aldo/keto reductase